MAHYRITPLEKKSIEVFFELYRQNPETGEVSWLNINETYRQGRAFIAEDMDCNLPRKGDNQAYCRMEEGEYEGCEFDDSIGASFEFSDDITEDEQDAITYVEEALDNSSFIQEDGIIGVEVMADDVELFEEEEESYEDDMEEDYNEN